MSCQDVTRSSLCSGIKQCGTKRAHNFLFPKSSFRIRRTTVLGMFKDSVIIFDAIRPSFLTRSATSAVFTSVRVDFGRPPLSSSCTSSLTYCMVQSPSSEANWFAASQEIPRISRNPKVHYRTHNRPPPVSILCQPNPVHIPTSHLLEIHPNIHPSTPRSPSGLLPSGFPTKTLYTSSPHPYAPHAQPISFFSTLSPAQYWVRGTNHLAPRYAISSIPPLPCPS